MDINKVVGELEKCACMAVQDEDGIHAETAIAALASIAGTTLLLACIRDSDLKDLQGGQALFSTDVNDHAPRLIQAMSEIAEEIGLALEKHDFAREVPPDHQPKEHALQLARKLRKPCWEIFEANNIKALDRAMVSAIATITLLKRTESVLDPRIGIAVAIEAVITASKAVPLNA